MFRAAGTYVGRGGCDFCAPAVRLSDGTVLLTGQAPAQLYDPASDSFSPSGMTISDPSNAAALTNGDDSYIRLYREHDVATPLAYAQFAPSGAVLAAGGETYSCSGRSCVFAGSVASAGLYDPASGAFIRLSAIEV
jgi:hypothetical protein